MRVRGVLVGAIVAVAASRDGGADPKPVPAATQIDKAIEHEFSDSMSDSAGIVPIGPGGTIGSGIDQRTWVAHRIGDQRLNGMSLHLAVGEEPVISVDDASGIAWFTFAASVNDGKNDPVALEGLEHRITGLAVRDGATWKLATYMIANLIPDKDLFASAWTEKPPAAPAATGDLKVAALVTGWFTTGFASHGVATTGAPPLVAGSSVAEHGAGAIAGRLVKAWDQLKLRPTEIEARVIGKLAIASGVAMLPYKDKFATLAFTVFLVASKSGWQWAAIQYSAMP